MACQFNDFVISDEPLYILILFWLMMAGPGRASLDHLISSALGVDIELRESAGAERWHIGRPNFRKAMTQ